jgi:exonuclease III
MLVHIQITEYVHYAGNVSDFFCLISTWNINEYISKCYNKFQDLDFINNLVDQDIFCLQETHSDLDLCLQLDDFSRPVHLIRPKLKQTGKRSGGLSVYIRNNIRPGVSF